METKLWHCLMLRLETLQEYPLHLLFNLFFAELGATLIDLDLHKSFPCICFLVTGFRAEIVEGVASAKFGTESCLYGSGSFDHWTNCTTYL
jgi:hypothetical protein